jgi:PIN domain nuclease of toxin-antitoxin system
MRILLDTHIFLWFLSANARLSSFYRQAIQDPRNEVFLSVASVWESIIKHGLGKLPLPAPPSEYLPRQREVLEISSLVFDEQTLVFLDRLPMLHGDPFDRITIAQAQQHNLVVATVDRAMRSYPVALL